MNLTQLPALQSGKPSAWAEPPAILSFTQRSLPRRADAGTDRPPVPPGVPTIPASCCYSRPPE